MVNMEYCRFHNTYIDLEDCVNSVHDELEGEEKLYRAALVQTCADLFDSLDIEYNYDNLNEVLEELRN